MCFLKSLIFSLIFHVIIFFSFTVIIIDSINPIRPKFIFLGKLYSNMDMDKDKTYVREDEYKDFVKLKDDFLIVKPNYINEKISIKKKPFWDEENIISLSKKGSDGKVFLKTLFPVNMPDDLEVDELLRSDFTYRPLTLYKK